jgi:TBC1 domain family member 13
LNPQFYALRWITTLLSQEFSLPELMRIWDGLFASDDKMDFLMHFCLAMLLFGKGGYCR